MVSKALSAYIAFDRYPSSKGSATHMEQMLEVLKDELGPTLLYSLPGTFERDEKDLEHRVFDQAIANFLERAETFSRWVLEDLRAYKQVRIVHFRDIWGGLAATGLGHSLSVFEVNALPSIELPYRYPYLHASTLEKVRELEDRCLSKADRILVPSEVIRTHLLSRKVDEEKIRVITNGAFEPGPPTPISGLPEDYILFFGALQSWQGVSTLLKSMTYLTDIPKLKLMICSSQPEKQVREYRKIISRLGIEDRVEWKYQLDKEMLSMVIRNAIATVAPLTECSRNIVQGCSPLKIFESMAHGVPVIASDLQVVRDLMINEKEGLIVPADRPAALARAIRRLYEDRDMVNELGKGAYARFGLDFRWEQKHAELRELYQDLITEPIPMK